MPDQHLRRRASRLAATTPTTVYAAFDNHKKGDFKPYLLQEHRPRARPGRRSPATCRRAARSTRSPRTTVDPQPALRRHRVRPLLHARRRQALDPAQGRPADDRRPRPRDPEARERSRRRHVRPRLLHPRRLHAAARGEPGGARAGRGALPGAQRAASTSRRRPLGFRGKGFQGDAFYTAPNPPFGAVFTYYLKDGAQDEEEGAPGGREEGREGGRRRRPIRRRRSCAPRRPRRIRSLLFTITDADGNVVRRLTAPGTAGVHRVAWDLRFPPSNPSDTPKPDPTIPWQQPPTGPMAVPGKYTRLAREARGRRRDAARRAGRASRWRALGAGSLPPADRAELLAFQRKTARLQRAVLGAVSAAKEDQKRLAHMKQALHDTPARRPGARRGRARARGAPARRSARARRRQGDGRSPGADGARRSPTGSTRSSATQWSSTSAPTQTSRDDYTIAAEEFAPVLEKLRQADKDLASLESRMEAAGAPWTPGRVPTWRPE